MVSAGLIVIDRRRVAVVIPSAAWAVKLDVPAVVGVPEIVPAVVGVPEITPEAAVSDSPAGSEPADIDQV